VLANEILNLITIQQAHSDDNLPLPSVRLYDVYEDSEYVHLVMENCKGGSIAKIISPEPDSDGCDEEDEDVFHVQPKKVK